MPFDANLGPLAPLPGIWEGEKGTDLAHSDDPVTDRQPAISKYRERMVYEPTGRIENHEQVMYGLRYATKAWRIGAPDPFHEEVGYWLWDPAAELVMRSFMPPRGMAVLAGGNAKATATEFSLEAKSGDEVFGVCSSPFLTAEFKTVLYQVTLKLLDDNTLYYDEHTWLKVKGRDALFDHHDENTLRRA